MFQLGGVEKITGALVITTDVSEPPTSNDKELGVIPWVYASAIVVFPPVSVTISGLMSFVHGNMWMVQCQRRRLAIMYSRLMNVLRHPLATPLHARSTRFPKRNNTRSPPCRGQNRMRQLPPAHRILNKSDCKLAQSKRTTCATLASYPILFMPSKNSDRLKYAMRAAPMW